LLVNAITILSSGIPTQMNALALYRNRIRGINAQHRGDLGECEKGASLRGFKKSLMREEYSKLGYRCTVEGED